MNFTGIGEVGGENYIPNVANPMYSSKVPYVTAIMKPAPRKNNVRSYRANVKRGRGERSPSPTPLTAEPLVGPKPTHFNAPKPTNVPKMVTDVMMPSKMLPSWEGSRHLIPSKTLQRVPGSRSLAAAARRGRRTARRRRASKIS